MAFEVTEQSIGGLAPNDKAMEDARELVRSGALRNLAKNDDGSLVFGDCRGSGGAPYNVSMDLAVAGDKPALRCTCPSRQRPCKHILGLMLTFAQKGASFPITTPPQELLDKRAQEAAKPVVKTPRAKSAGPQNRNQSALAKKGKDQIDALETLGTFLVDLVNVGVGGITPKMIKEIDQQGKRMADANVFVAWPELKRLSAAIAEPSDDDADDDDDDDDDEDEGEAKEKTAAKNLSKETEARVSWMITHLYAMVRRGIKLLDGRLESEGASQLERDATYDLIFSRRWQLRDLKHAGYWVTDRRYLEISHENRNYELLEFVEATGYLLDLEDGSIVREWTALPYGALYSGQKLRVSRRGTLVVKEAGLYPGEMANRRIRWDEKQEDACLEVVRKDADYESVHYHAKPIDAVLKAFRAHLRNPLHPLDGVYLVAAARIGMVGSELVVEDAAKDRLIMHDLPGAIVSGTVALRQAAAAYGPGSLAVRLHFDLITRSVQAEPLALFVKDEQLRLHA